MAYQKRINSEFTSMMKTCGHNHKKLTTAFFCHELEALHGKTRFTFSDADNFTMVSDEGAHSDITEWDEKAVAMMDMAKSIIWNINTPSKMERRVFPHAGEEDARRRGLPPQYL